MGMEYGTAGYWRTNQPRMKVLLFMIVVLTAVFDANCQNFHNGPMSEVQIFPNGTVNTDYTDEDRILPIQQFYNNSTDETNRLLFRTENSDTDEEDRQMNKKCKPKKNCNKKKGSCISKSATCTGKVIKNGCKTSDCQCCAPPKSCKQFKMCQRMGGSCISPNLKCDGKVLPKKCNKKDKCQCCKPNPTDTTTTTPTTTTPGSTEYPGLNWLSIGTDRFVSYHEMQTMNWTDARDICRSRGLDLYEPNDSIAVSQYLKNKFSEGTQLYYWIGGRSNGTHPIWLSGGEIPSNGPWWSSYIYSKDSNRCIWLGAYGSNPDNGKVLGSNWCYNTYWNRPLCG